MSTCRRQQSISEVAAPEIEEGFDGLLTSIGFGSWQVIILLLPMLAMSVFPVHMLGASFLNAPVPFRCSMGQTDNICVGESCSMNNNSVNINNDISNNNDTNNSNNTYYNSQCLSPTVLNATSLQFIEDSTLNWNQRRTNLPSCPIIEYDPSDNESTVVSEFDLVCERSYLMPLFSTFGTLGSMIGSLFGGFIGDRFGRLLAVKISSVGNIVMVVAMTFTPNYPLLLLTRLIHGCFLTCALVSSWSLGIEVSPSKHRNLVGMFLGLPFSVFLIAYAGMAYLIRTWRYLIPAATAASLLMLPCSFIATESPRWLLQKGRKEEAEKVLQKATKLNKSKLDDPIKSYVEKLAMVIRTEETSSVPEENRSFKRSVLESLKRGMKYLKSTALRTIMLCMGVIWICHNILYTGIGINTNNFANDYPYMYVALTGVMDISAILLITPLTSCFGRRVFLMAGYAGGGALFFFELLVPEDLTALKWVMVMTGFFLVAGSMQVNFLYAPEVFPTEIRARGFAFVQLLGNLGTSIAPFITDIGPQYGTWVPGVVFGCCGFVGAVLVPLLPETRNKPLPETIQEIEERRKNSRRHTRPVQGVENKSYLEEVSCH